MKALGFSLLFFALVGLASSQDDPFANPGVRISKEAALLAEFTNVDLVFEVFSLPRDQAAGLLRTGHGDEEVYAELVEGLEGGEVIQDSFQSVNARSGQFVVLEDGEQLTYPTEWEAALGVEHPPNLEAYEKMWAPPLPTSFETKNLGYHISVEPTLDLEAGLIEAHIAIFKVSLRGFEEMLRGESKVPMPRFRVSSINTQTALPLGGRRFLGTLSDGGGKVLPKRVRFAFLSATIDEGEPKVAIDWNWRMTYEVFAMPTGLAASLRRELGKGDLYETVLARKKQGECRQEQLISMSGFAGQTMTLGQIQEMIYPTEYEPPGFGNDLVLPQAMMNTSSRFFPVMPVNFETKSVGEWVEMEFQIGDGEEVELRLTGRHVTDLKRRLIGQGLAAWEMPEFTVSALKTGVSIPSGKASLAGTVNRVDQPDEVRWVFVTFSKQP